MKLAIMQPYVFPYSGYFQLMRAVDKFVVYDDVNFIKGGWINRNRILLNGKDLLFSIPLQDASSFKKINQVSLHERLYAEWKKKFYKSLHSAYAKAPFFEPVFSLIKKVLDTNTASISVLATTSIVAVKNYLQWNVEVLPTSSSYGNEHLCGKERVIDICLKEGAKIYINAKGGQELYNKSEFQSHDIALCFVQPEKRPYKQFNNDFVPWLSIIDMLMFNSVSEANKLLSYYSLQ